MATAKKQPPASPPYDERREAVSTAVKLIVWIFILATCGFFWYLFLRGIEVL